MPTRPPGDHVDQVAQRDEASRADAQVMATRRAAAASRALANLGSLIEEERNKPTRAPEPITPPPIPVGTPPLTPASNAPAPPPPPPDPLLEVKPSPLSTDIDHLGERLAIFNDRVELRDRNDHARRTVTGDEITDVVVNKRLTGAVLTIETVDGPIIVAKGLRPEQAEAARNLIMRRTRQAHPIDPSSRPTSRPAATDLTLEPPAEPLGPAAAPAKPTGPRLSRANESDLLRKLGDLHRAGVLDDEEYAAKIDLVARMVRGDDPDLTVVRP